MMGFGHARAEVIVAKSYEAYYDLLLQMNSGERLREPWRDQLPKMSTSRLPRLTSVVALGEMIMEF